MGVFSGGGRHVWETPPRQWHVCTMGGKASNYNVDVYLSNFKDSNVRSESANQPWHEYHADIYNLCKSGQVGVGSNISQNHSSILLEVIYGHYLPQYTWKVDQNRN